MKAHLSLSPFVPGLVEHLLLAKMALPVERAIISTTCAQEKLVVESVYTVCFILPPTCPGG